LLPITSGAGCVTTFVVATLIIPRRVAADLGLDVSMAPA
jgi:hypothetical protein